MFYISTVSTGFRPNISPIFAKEESGIFYHVVTHLEPVVFNYNVLEKPSLPTRTNISTLSGSRVHA